MSNKIKLEVYIDEVANFHWNMVEVQEQFLADIPTMTSKRIILKFPGLTYDMLISLLCRSLIDQNKEIHKLRSDAADRIILEEFGTTDSPKA
jgi:hypothetical protein